MLNPGVVLDAVLAAYQAIPNLTSGRVFAYYEQSALGGPDTSLAIYQDMKRSDVMIAYMGFRPSRLNRSTVWDHVLSLLWRPPLAQQNGPNTYQTLWLLVNGVPALAGNIQRVVGYEFLPDVNIMAVPTAVRKKLVVDASTAIDYWEMEVVLPEKSDA